MTEEARDRLTPAQILLIVVVSALVLLFAILLAGRLAGGAGDPGAEASQALDTEPEVTPSDAEEPTSAQPEETTTPAPPPEYFASPSGNIVCALTADSADCVISNFSYEPADLSSCDGEEAGGHLRVEPAGASMPCDPLVVAGDVSVLDYGESTSAHGYTCESAETGVTCRHDESDYGFSVARASYDLF